MGGGHAVANITPSAEFNIWADPEAAQFVFRCGIVRITLIPLDATHKALISLDDCRAMRACGTAAGTLAAQFIEHRIAGYEQGQPMDRPHTAPVHDALCVAFLIDPAVITTQRLHVDVETSGSLTLGRTVIDIDQRLGLSANADVALDADGRRFAELLIRTLA